LPPNRQRKDEIMTLRISALVLLGLAICTPQAFLVAQDSAETKVELQVVKYKDLASAVRAQRGKVVVIDLWADWCIPCKQAFPHLVALHKRYAKDGLVCMSVGLMGDLAEIKDKDKLLTFLQKQQATFPNFFLEEEVNLWQEKFGINGPPTIFVFNRQGQWLRFDSNDPNKQYDEHDVEKAVQGFLAAK